MKKRILFISQYFFPEIFRGNDIAFDLAKRGVEVTVICGTPNYPKGSFFKGYSWFKRRKEIVNGVNVIRIPIIPRGHNSKVFLILNYFSYFIIASLYIPFHLLLNPKYDICFVQQLSPVMMSVPGVIFKKITGRRLCTWVLDLWPESLKVAGGITNSKILNFFGWFAKLQYKYSDIIYVSSKSFGRNISQKGDFAYKIKHLPNWAEDEICSVEVLPIPPFPDGFNIVFTGNIGEAQDFESIINAAKLLDAKDKINFIVVGDGRKKDWVMKQVREYNLDDRFFLMGRYDIRYMSSFFQQADCLLLSLKNDEIMNITVPAKLQAYMSSGKPIVAMINGEANELINEIKCGFAVSASSPKELVKSIKQLKSLQKADLHNMGARGKQYYNCHYKKSTILDLLFNDLLN